MSESENAAKVVHPLVQLVLSAKAILEAHVEPMGPSKAETIAALCKLFDGDQEALAAHDRLVAEVAALRAQIAAKDEIANAVLNDALAMKDPVRERLALSLKTVIENWSNQFERNGHNAPSWVKDAQAALKESGGA